MKKIVLKLDIHDDKCKKKAMKTASGISGVDSVALDQKDNKLTVTGDIDPVVAVSKLRKVCHTDIVSVGPAKEPEKKKEEPKKEEPKKDEPKKEPPKPVPITIYPPYYYQYQPQMSTYYPPPPSDFGYGCKVVEEHQPTCVIC